MCCDAGPIPATMSHFMPLTHHEWLEVLSNLDADGDPIPGRPQRVSFDDYDYPEEPVIVYNYNDVETGAVPTHVSGEQ